MNEILNTDSYKGEREKWTAYLTVLQRYLHFADNERAQGHLAILKQESVPQNYGNGIEEEKAGTYMNHSIIIESVPSKFRSKAKLLLRYLHDATPAKFSCNSGGVVSVDGKEIKNSNIVDLVNDAMRARKTAKPMGRLAFTKFLKSIQAPREFVGNQELWMDSRVNSTLQDNYSSNDVDGENSDIPHSQFYSGSDNSSDNARYAQWRW